LPGNDPAPSAPPSALMAGAASVAAVARMTDRLVNFMEQCSSAQRSAHHDAIAGDYVGFSVRHQRPFITKRPG
jgi:aspartokinase